MTSLDIYFRGNAKFSERQKKRKPFKCSFLAVKRGPKTLKTLKITWQKNPARLISARLKFLTNKNLTLATLLSHNLIWNEILDLLAANFYPD